METYLISVAGNVFVFLIVEKEEEKWPL
jgi:hypothetical protein